MSPKFVANFRTISTFPRDSAMMFFVCSSKKEGMHNSQEGAGATISPGANCCLGNADKTMHKITGIPASSPRRISIRYAWERCAELAGKRTSSSPGGLDPTVGTMKVWENAKDRPWMAQRRRPMSFTERMEPSVPRLDSGSQ
jgi:hypothetical protein